MKKAMVLLSALTLCALAGVMACKSDSDDAPTVSSIEIVPSAISVGRGATKTFSAKVNGAPADTVTWSIESDHLPGTAISNEGVLTLDAAETPKVLTVRATSTQDTAKYAEGTVNVSDVAEWKKKVESSFGTSPIRSIVYNNEKFIAVGLSGKIATSAVGDVTTWTQYPPEPELEAEPENPFGGGAIYAIAYGGGTFVAGGEIGKVATFDGTTWTPIITDVFGSNSITGIAYDGDKKFVAIAKNGILALSEDKGATWKAAESPFETPTDLYGIAYGDGIFVAVGGKSAIASSPGGDIWTLAEDVPFDANSVISSITWGGGTFVVGDGQGKIATSSDNGETWTAVADSTFAFNNGIKSLSYGIDTFVAGSAQGKMATSPDGKNWTALTNDVFASTSIDALAYGSGTFIAVGNDGKMAYWKP